LLPQAEFATLAADFRGGRMTRLIACIALILALSASASAEDVAGFYRGRTVTCYVGYGVGGAYDLYAREISKFLPRHIPGEPKVAVENMPGASSMVLANYLARRAPRDGTVLGAVNSALIFDPLFSGPKSKAQFEGPDMTMVGNAVSAAAVLISWKTSGVMRFEDLQQKKLILGAISRTGDTYVLPLAMKRLLDLKNLEIVTGYPGSREVLIALEQGEITGRVWDMEGIRGIRPGWLQDGSINLIVQLAAQKMPEVPETVPLLKDFVASEEDRRILDVVFMTTLLARPYIAPRGIPADRVEALRHAFTAVMQDPDFQAETARAQLEMSPMSGAEMERNVRAAYALPEALIAKVRRTLAD
jgi:tripartite-type tricarboxylate transporter receptor subunit TctC